jgi:two-component system C4-dicarboxylate transport sensor histidine kinase DctB
MTRSSSLCPTTGRASPPRTRPRVFSAFFTTKSDGLGLGLSISQGIVEDFGGQLTYRGRPEGGTVFAIDLRRAP